jgi:hypothetical protein
MNGIWRRDRDDLDIRLVEEHTPIGSPAQKPELPGGLLCRSLIDIGNGCQDRTQAARKNAGNSPIGKGMGLAHETRANDADANISHAAPIRFQVKL